MSPGDVDASLEESQRSLNQSHNDQADDSMGTDLPDVDGLQCAAVLDGGMDDITPVEIWNAVMQKYKVAQKCEEALAKLD